MANDDRPGENLLHSRWRWRVPCRSWFIPRQKWELSRECWHGGRKCNYPPPRQTPRRRWNVHGWAQQHWILGHLFSTILLACLSNSIHSQFSHAHIFFVHSTTFSFFIHFRTEHQHFKLTEWKIGFKVWLHKFHLIFGNLIKFKFHSALVASHCDIPFLCENKNIYIFLENHLKCWVWLTRRKVLIDCHRQHQSNISVRRETIVVNWIFFTLEHADAVSCYRHKLDTLLYF